MLLGTLGDVGVADQAAEQGGNLRPDVQLFLRKATEEEVKLISLVKAHHPTAILEN